MYFCSQREISPPDDTLQRAISYWIDFWLGKESTLVLRIPPRQTAVITDGSRPFGLETSAPAARFAPRASSHLRFMQYPQTECISALSPERYDNDVSCMPVQVNKECDLLLSLQEAVRRPVQSTALLAKESKEVDYLRFYFA